MDETLSAVRRRDNDELVALALADDDTAVVLECECDDPLCNALVVVRLGELAALRARMEGVLARDHAPAGQVAP